MRGNAARQLGKRIDLEHVGRIEFVDEHGLCASFRENTSNLAS